MAYLRPQELTALYQLNWDASYPVSHANRQLLLSMNLIRMDGDLLSLTDDGRECLERDQGQLLVMLLEDRLIADGNHLSAPAFH